MPLSADPVPRIRKHTRSVRFEGHARADGLWDIEANLTDVTPGGHALDTGGEAARLYYPRWQRAAKTGTDWRRLTWVNARACACA